MLARVDLRGSADVRARARATAGRGRRRRARRSPRSSPTSARGATPRSATYTERFDGCRLDDLAVAARRDATPRSTASIPGCAPRSSWPATRSSRGTRRRPGDGVEHVRAGVRVRELLVPVDRAGCYVPGGRAPLASSVLMTALPARVAGRPRRRAVHAARARRHGARRDPRRGARSPRSTSCTASAARRRSPRWRTAPRRSPRST